MDVLDVMLKLADAGVTIWVVTHEMAARQDSNLRTSRM